MNRYHELIQRLLIGEQILIDGASGTEIERRGVPTVDNSSAAYSWRQQGVQVVDGCCGIGLGHIQALKNIVKNNTTS